MALRSPLRARIPAAVTLILIAFLTSSVLAQNGQRRDHANELAEWIRANYTKYEYRVPMRDGARLFTSVYLPKDASATQTYPIMFERTPYTVAPYGEDKYPAQLGPNEQFARSKYIFVYQDVRGRFMSEGQFEDMRPYNPDKKSTKDVDESTDTYDTIDWLVKNIPFNNGKVGMWGISYPGFYAACALIGSHPALKAVSPQAPIGDWFIGDDFHHNGALWLPHMFNFMYTFGVPRPELTTKWPPRIEHGTPDGYSFFMGAEPLSNVNAKWYHNDVAFWNDVVAHPNYDAFWQARNLPHNIKNVKPAVLVVGGWFDAEDLYGALHTAEAVANTNPSGPVTLVMGPWFHGGWARSDGSHLGDAQFGSKTAVYYREQIEFPFFEYHLKGKGTLDLPKAYVFQTGLNQWEKYDSWPPKNAVKEALYLCAGGKLAFAACPATAKASPRDSLAGLEQTGRDFDEYVSDPFKPVPYIDATGNGMSREYMTADQRLQGHRTDVLEYQTEPLQHDVTVAGPVRPNLFVSTTGTDSDFIVKLIDVYPGDAENPEPNPTEVEMGGYEQLIRGEPMRGRYRNSYEKPEPFVPGKVTKVEFVMPDVNHTFRRGHRIMVQVQSSWFPLVDINPQKFVDIYTAKPEDFQKATERIYHTGEAASRVNVLVLPQPAATAEQSAAH